MRFFKPVLFATALLSLTLAGGANAAASCVQPKALPEEIAAAKTVFVGTVVFTWDGDRRARVHVESVWRGAALSAYVEVHGSPADGMFSATSVDRTYRAGERYLFVLFGDSQPFQDNICTSTQVYTEAFDAYAPANPTSPMNPTPLDPVANVAGPYWPAGLVVLLLAAAGAAILVLLRRRTRPTV